MREQDIEGSYKWLNDPGPISEEDLEVSDDDFEMWAMCQVKAETIIDPVTRAAYDKYLTKGS